MIPTRSSPAGGPNSRSPGTSGEALEGVGAHLRLVCVGRVEADGVEPFDRGCEADGLGDRRRSGLESSRDAGPGDPLLGHLADHRSAPFVRSHGVEQVASPVEHADPGGPVELVAGEPVEVRSELGQVELELGRRLGPVDDHDRPDVVRQPGDLGDRVDRAEHVGYVGHGDELGPPLERRPQRFEVEAPVAVHWHPVQLRPDLLGQQVPGDDVRVVLHLGEQDAIPRADVGAPPGAGDEVQGPGDVAGEDDLPRVDPEVPGDRGAGPLVHRRRLFGERVHAPMHVRVVLAPEAVERLDHRGGLLRGRAVVEIGDRLPVDAALENRELGADPVDRQARDCDRRGGHEPRRYAAAASTSSRIQP